MKVSVVTPTKDRPECLKLCKEYVARQTYKVYEHIIAEGGGLYENMYAALARVTGDVVVIFEDDDWYDRGWVAKCVDGLKDNDLFGQGKFFYYHIPSSGYILKDADRVHAPLHATSFRASMINQIVALPKLFKRKKPLFDASIWQMPNVRKNRTMDKYVVSLKGLPGLKGYSSSHLKGYFDTFDHDRSLLRSWINEDVDIYSSFFK